MASIFTRYKTEIILDDEDYDKAKEYMWIIDHNIPRTLIEGKLVSIEKIIFGVDQSQRIIHKNKNIYDFRRSNIAICSRETYKYLALAEINKIHSKYYGVVKAKKSWAAKVYSSDERTFETYHTEWEAAVAADYHAILKYKEFALRNFPGMSFEEIKKIHDKAYSDIINNKSEYKSKIGQKAKRIVKNNNYIGVRKASDTSWDVEIKHMDKRYRYRLYSEKDAAIVYDMKAVELYGENAKRNFPEIEVEKLKELYKEALKNKDPFYDSRIIQGRKVKNRKVSSKYVGVSFIKRKGLWMASITFNYRQYHIGLFDNEEEAARAYDQKAIELYGEEAKVNFKT